MLAISELFLSSPKLVLAPTIDANPDASVCIEPQPAMDTDRQRFFVHVECDDFDAFEAALEDDYTAEDPFILTESDGFRIYRLTLTDEVTVVSPQVAELGGIVLEMQSRNRGWQVKLQVPDRETLAAFRDFCVTNDIEYELERLYQTEPNRQTDVYLRESQREMLLTAYEAGYFEVPRAASQAELATELGISDSAVSQRVRRAVERLIANTIAADAGPASP